MTAATPAGGGGPAGRGCAPPVPGLTAAERGGDDVVRSVADGANLGTVVVFTPSLSVGGVER